MSAFFILIIISLSVACGFLIAFIWAVKSGQLEDTYTPSIRMLWDHKQKIVSRADKQKKEEQ